MSKGKKVPVVPAMNWFEIGRISRRLIRIVYPDHLVQPVPIPVDEFLEFKMKQVLGFDFEINELPTGIEAAMEPTDKLMILSPQTYDDLAEGMPRARFTVAHEIGHVVLHARYLQHRLMDGGQLLKLNRGDIAPFRDPECQANAFAAAFLMPTDLVDRLIQDGADAFFLADTFNVSWESAEYRIKNLWRYKK